MKKVWGKSLSLILGALCVLLLLIVGIYATGIRTMNFGVNINMNASMLVKIEMGTVPSSDAVNCNYVTIFNNSQISGSGAVSEFANLSVDTVSLSSTLISNWLGEGQSLTSGTKLYFRVTNYTDSAYTTPSGITTPAIFARANATTIISGLFTEERVYSSTTDPVNGAQNITAYNGVLANAVSKEMSLEVETVESGTIRIDLNLSVQEQGDKEVAMQISGVSSSNTDEYIKTSTDYTTTLTANSGLVLPADLNVLVGETQLNNTGDSTGFTYNNSTGVLSIPANLITNHLIITGEAKEQTVDVGFEFRKGDVFATYGGKTYSNGQGFSALSSENIEITLTSTKFVCPEVLVWKDGVGEKQWVSLNGLDYAFNQTTAGSGTLTINKKEITDKVLIRATSVKIWDGTSATEYASGDGSETSPYQIATAEQLAYLATQVDAGTTYSGKYFELTNNILLNNLTNYTTFTTTGKFTTETRWATDSTGLNQWNPIGNETYYFQGNFNGNGFVVSGMYINTTDSYQGLFDRIYYSETKDFGVVNGYVKAVQSVGGLAWRTYYSKIENCYSTINTYATTTGRASGLIAWINYSDVSNCYVNSHINSTGAYGGLFCAISYQKSVMSNCFSYGVAVGNNVLGGIAGNNGSGAGTYGYINSCVNYGAIVGVNAGGISGYNGETGTVPNSAISNTMNYGVVYGTFRAGGITGLNYASGSSILNCSNFGKVIGDYVSYIGVLAGENRTGTIIENCYYVGEFNTAIGTNSGIATNLSSFSATSLKLNSNVYVGDNLVDNVQSVGTGTLYESGTDLIDVLNAWSIENSQMKWVRMESGKLSPSGNAVDYFAGGSGSSTLPYLISTAQQLANIAYLVKDNNFALTGNIDLNPGVTFTFKADSGLVEITNGTATVFMGTGIKGDTSGASGTFDTAASTQGAYYISGTATTQATATTSTYRFLTSIRKTTIKNGGSTIIVLNEWSPIGNDDRDIQSRFSGTFNGATHEISGLFINATVTDMGLFGYCSNGTTIENVSTINGVIRSSVDYVGGICGRMSLYVANDLSSVINNCYNNATILSGATRSGGIVGILYTNSVNYSAVALNCVNYGTIIGTTNYIGGIVGDNSTNSYTYNCFNFGDVYSIYTANVYSGLGGLSGWGNLGIHNTYSVGFIKSFASNRTNVGSIQGNMANALYYSNNHYITNTAYIDTIAQLGVGGTTSSNSTDTGCTAYSNTGTLTYNGAKIANTTVAEKNAMLDALNSYVSTNPSITFNGQTYSLNQWARDSSDDANGGASAINAGFPYFSTGEDIIPIEPDESFSGAGTLASPFIISTASELALLASEVNSGVTYEGIYFQQSADIFLTSTWSPIGTNGTNGNAFMGIYNGNDYSISGLRINSINSENQGLFGYVNGATIYNIAIKSANIQGKVNVGALAGYAVNSYIYNISTSGSITAGGNVGGIVGKARGTYVKNSYSSTALTNTNLNIGGIVGDANSSSLRSSKIENVYFSGQINANNLQTAGGIVGYAYQGTSVKYAFFKASCGVLEAVNNIQPEILTTKGFYVGTDIVDLLNEYAGDVSTEFNSWKVESSSSTNLPIFNDF